MRRLGRFVGHRTAATSWYAGLLRLRHLELTGLRGILLAEGSVLLGGLLAFAEIASWWAAVAVPAAVAAMVKLHDILRGLLAVPLGSVGVDVASAPPGSPPAVDAVAPGRRRHRRADGPPRRVGAIPHPSGVRAQCPADGPHARRSPAGVGESADPLSGTAGEPPAAVRATRGTGMHADAPGGGAGRRRGAAAHPRAGRAVPAGAGPGGGEPSRPALPEVAAAPPHHRTEPERTGTERSGTAASLWHASTPDENLPPPVDPYAGHPIVDGRPIGRDLIGIPLNPDDGDGAGLHDPFRAWPYGEEVGYGIAEPPDDAPHQPCQWPGLPTSLTAPAAAHGGPSAPAGGGDSSAGADATGAEATGVEATGDVSAGAGGGHARAPEHGIPDGGRPPRHVDSPPAEPRVVGQRPAPPAEQSGPQHWRARQSAAHHYE